MSLYDAPYDSGYWTITPSDEVVVICRAMDTSLSSLDRWRAEAGSFDLEMLWPDERRRPSLRRSAADLAHQTWLATARDFTYGDSGPCSRRSSASSRPYSC